MLDTVTKHRIDNARNILVGKVPDPKSQVEQITIALIYKFMNDMDAEAEELGGERTFFSGEFEKYAWHQLMNPKMGGFEVLNLYAESIQKMVNNVNIPQLFREIFKNAYLPYRDPETLKSFLKIINDFEYDHSERLGDAFEYLLSVLGSQGDAGQFRTPRHIIDFMVSIIDPKKDETILDPACGTAGFLISAYKHILKANSSNYDAEKDKYTFEMQDVKLGELTINGKRYKGDNLTPDERSRIIKNIRGYDISPDMVRLSLVNLYLHEFTDPHIYEYDTLTSDERWNEFADVILANPPFMSPKGGIRPHKRFSITSNRSEVLFVDYMAEHLTPNGRAAIIVPEGIIFQSGTAYKSLRKMLVDKNYLVGVISLPAGMFNPYSGVKTSILWLDKALAKKTDKILFAKVEADGFDLGAQRRPVKQNDLPEIFQKITRYKNALINDDENDLENVPNLSLVEKNKIGENGEYNLSSERYNIGIELSSQFNLLPLQDLVIMMHQGINTAGDKVKFENEGYPIIQARNMTSENIDFTNIKYLSQKDWIKYKGKYKPNIGNILFSNIGTIGKSVVVDKELDYLIHWNIFKIVVNQELIHPNYLKQCLGYLTTINFWDRFQKGGTVKFVNKKIINEIKIPLPPLSVQEEIVAEIEGYQKIIDGARQIVENYKPQITIDPDWEMVELKTVFTKINKSIIPKDLNVDVVNYIGLENITQGSGQLTGSIETNPSEIKSTKTIFKKGDILYGKLRPNLNKVYFAKIEGICSTDIFVLRSNGKNFPEFFSSYFLSDRFNIEVLKGLKGAQLPRVGYEYFSQIKIPKPSVEIQEQIASQIKKENELVKANKKLISIFEQKIKDKIASVWGE